MSYRRVMQIVLLVLLCLSSISFGQQNNTKSADAQLKQTVNDQITLDQWLQGYMPQITVQDGVVTLTGKYKSEVQHKRVLAVVNRIRGVKKVVDKLELAKQ